MEDQIFLQSKYAKDLLKKLNMNFYKPVPTPLVVGQRLSEDDGEIKNDT